MSTGVGIDVEIMETDERCGEGRAEGLPVLLTVLWFEGRMSRLEEELGTGGGGICCEDARRGWGDGGTELRSGIVKLGVAVGLYFLSMLRCSRNLLPGEKRRCQTTDW